MERFLNARRKTELNSKPWWDEEAHAQTEQNDSPDGPLVLVQQGAKGTLISAIGPDALAEGLWPGMKLTDARSMMPEIRIEQHDRAADHRALSALADWMLRYSPAVAIHDGDGFVLDTTGCDHLFGGEQEMLTDIRKRLARMGLTTRLALCDNVAASTALVNHGAQEVHILSSGHGSDMLDALPVQALRLDDESVTLLNRLGLKRIGDVRTLPRIALERRFRDRKENRRKKNSVAMAQSVQWRLDQLSGAVAEPLHYIKVPETFRASLPCPDLALEQEAIGLALENLLPQLCAMLTKAGRGGRCFRLTGYRADGGTGDVTVYLSSPSRMAPDIKRLFADKLDQIDCGYGIDLFVLTAMGTEPFTPGQHDMIESHAGEQASVSLAAFADIITNRTGQQAVSKLAPRASHVPERAQQSALITAQVLWQDWEQVQPIWSPRPLRLLTRPEPAEVTAELPDSPPAQFIWRKVLRRVVRSRGPERILPEWWHDNLKSKPSASFRDYYDVEDTEGLRYWIFRSIKQEPLEQEKPLTANDNNLESKGEDVQEQEFITTLSWFVHGLF